MSADRKRVKRDDDKFFKRHAGRQYRVRRASPIEIREKQINGGLPPLPQGLSWFVAIWCPAPGRRICFFLPNSENADTSLDEGTAQGVFNLVLASMEAAHETRH